MYYVNSCWCAANSNCFLELHGILQYFQSLTDWITDREPTVQRTNCRNIVKFQGQRCTQLQCLSDTWKLLKTTTTCLATHEIRKKKFAFKYKRLMLNTGFKNTKFPFSTHIEWFEEWMSAAVSQLIRTCKPLDKRLLAAWSSPYQLHDQRLLSHLTRTCQPDRKSVV